VVGRHFDLIDEFGLGGAHLPTAARLDQDRFDEWCARREATGCRFSTSVHSLHELDTLSGNFEYAFLSPVFGSISKDLAGSAWRADELARAAFHPRWTVYALGGIDRSTISRARRVGFRGAGVIGAVWLADDPVGSFVELGRAAAAEVE
jgi:thiamine-phosphate pyrophosphorylase